MASDFLRMVGDRIRTLRKEKGYTQEFLAEKANIHYTYISDIERSERNISLETLEKVILALEVNPIEIFRFEGIESIEERNDKKVLIQVFNSLLANRRPEEIQMLLTVAKEITGTFDKLNNK